MILVDTSVWIEFFRGRDPIFTHLTQHLKNRQILALECVFAELLQGARGEREKTILHEMWESLPHFDGTNILLQAGEESGKQKWKDRGIGLIDAWIIITARLTESRIWSLDKKLLSTLTALEVYSP